MGRAGPGPVDYGFDRAGPGLGLKYMGPGWSGPRVGEPVANTAVYHKNMCKNVLNNGHGVFCESGIRACPESVGVGKFCRLRLRLRLREKQPTPTDSDSGSDSDSAALVITKIFVFT